MDRLGVVSWTPTVLARNDETGEATWRPIEAVLNSIHANDIIELTVQNKDGVTETITTTAEHPFMLRNTGWVDAAELANGDIIAGIHDDNAITVVDAHLVETQLYTYNLTVAEDHTYFVGYTDMWVHNANVVCDFTSKGTNRARRNGHLAGGNHPETGIPFDKNGYPDFSDVSKKDVDIEFTGSRRKDVKAANEAGRFKKTPEGYVWHHHQNGKTMQLVPRDVHTKTGHDGGVSGG